MDDYIDEDNEEPFTLDSQRQAVAEYFSVQLQQVLYDQNLGVLPMVNEDETGDSPMNVCLAVSTGNVQLVGCADLLILDRTRWVPADAPSSPHGTRVMPGVKILVHVDLETPRAPAAALFQTAAQLIALDLRASDPVLALLTNMTDAWQFLWVGDASTVHVATLGRADHAFAVLRSVLGAEATDDDDGDLLLMPCVSKEPVQRRKLSALAKVVRAPLLIDDRELEWISWYVDLNRVSRPLQ